MVIMTIITTMIILTWSALQNSYSYTVKSSEARSTARDTMERMRREIRDTQALSGQTGITQAGANEIRFTTAFNNPGSDGNGRIRLVRYWYTFDSAQPTSQWRLYRQRDENGDGVLNSSDPTRLFASNVVNGTVPNTAHPTPVFKYYAATGAETTDLTKIVTVETRVITDLNPRHSPTYFDLVTTVQPRNLRSL